MVGSRSNRVVVTLLAALLCAFLALPLSLFVGRGVAQADPVLSVSKSGGNVLLGGDATVSITVTNTSATDRGFNLSITDTFGSDPLRPDPPVSDGLNKTVAFVSASGSDGPLTPTSVTTDPLTNELTVRLDDIRDLAPGESTTVSIVVSPTDPLWAVNDKIVDNVTAEVNTVANGSGATITGTAYGESALVPIKMITKSANQSTADTQATGCGELIGGRWPYSYTLEVQNNFVNQTDDVVVTDDVPDGVEFMGMASGPAPDVNTRDDATGIRHLEWDVGDMAAGATWTATYDAGIRYDFYGTDNGGTNRAYDDYSGAPGSLGTPVPDKTGFNNTADLTAVYQTEPVTDSDSAAVTGTYVAIDKGVSPSSVGNGDTVTFTIRLRASEYYDILQDGDLLLTDTLPDGFTFDDTSASPAPSYWDYDAGTGVTTIEWDQTAFSGISAGGTAVFTFDATVNNAWVVPPDVDHLLIVAGDSMTNDSHFEGTWHDTVDAGRPDGLTDANSSASTVVVGPRPTISKQISLDGTTYLDSVDAAVGDTLYFRVRFNTTDGSSPQVTGVNFGNVDVVDWYPLGTSLAAAPAVMTYSDAGDFSYGYPVKFSAQFDDQPEAVTSGELTGGAWSLGDVAQDGWWQAVFQVVVDDDIVNVVDGKVNNDFAKLSWNSSVGGQFSDRDLADVVCTEPELTAAKSVTSTPANPGAGQDWGYRITLTNTGTAAARNVLVTDTLPLGMRNYDPTTGTVTVTRGATTLTLGTDYTLNYTPATGVFLIDFDNGSTIRTEIPAPPSADSVVTIDYTARVDNTVGAGATLTNNVSVTWSAQNAGTTPTRDYGPATASAGITLPNITIAKSIVGTNTVPLGTGAASEVTYRLTVTIPASNLATGSGVNRLQDLVQQDGLEYVTGSTSMADVSGTPPVPARFSDASTTMDPTINWGSPNPGSTLTWGLANSISNLGQATAYVFRVDFKLLATGLITPVSQGGSAADPANWRFWPNTGGDPTVTNSATDRGNIRWSDGFTSRTANSGTVTTYLQQPYMEMSKTNDKVGPPEVLVKAGDTVGYTITASNTGTSASYDNMVVDTLPAGMRDADPSATVAVTVNGAPVAFTTGWNGGTGELTVTVNAGVSVPAGQDLVVTYTATVDGDVGSGATLVNNAYVEYRSESGAGRHVTENDDSTGSNKASSQVRTPEVTSTKTALNNPATIGNTVGYEVQMTVPAGTIMYSPEIVDVIDQDGIEYVAGSSSLSRVSGPDPGPALGFIDGSQPSVDYDTPDPGATFTWLLNDVDNSGGADFTFKLSFSCRVTGLIDPAGSPSDQDNWVWWWNTGGDPTIDNTADDIATIDWSDGVDPHSIVTPPATQHVWQPNLDLTKDNDSGGTALPGGSVNYTITVVNSGLGTSWRNVLVDTLPDYMTDTDPSGTVAATLNGSPLTPGVDFTASMAGNQLTVDFTAGSGGAIVIPAGQDLVVTYSGTVNSQVGAGAALTNVASVEFNSFSDGSGRQVPLSTDVSQHNTDDSTADIPPATIAKSQDAAGDLSAIGQPYTYWVDVTVPAHTTVYNAAVTDDVADGLAVDGYATYVDGVPQAVGTVAPSAPVNGPVTVTWDMGDYTNNTGADQVVSLGITVHIRTNYSGGGAINAGATFDNAADLDWDDAETGGAHHTDSDSADTVTATEPDLTLTKVNDAAGPIPGGQTVHYTLTAVNNGTSASYQNVLTDTLPVGMRNIPPAVTNVTLAGVPLMVNVDYWVAWNAGTGELTIDLDNGSSQTNIQPGPANQLVVYVNATPSAVAGAGATLVNSAVVDYDSWSGPNGRSYATPPATSSITILPATIAKTHNAPAGRAGVGQPFTYFVSVSVPAYTTIYNAAVADSIADGLAVDGYATYVDGSPQAVGVVAPAAPFNGPAVLIWAIGDYTNNTGAAQQVQLRLTTRIRTNYAGGAPVPAGAVFANSAGLGWDDADTGGAPHSDTDTAPDVTATAPSLSGSKANDAAGPVVGGQPVNYTLTFTNTGNGTSYQNVITDTLPVGMRNNTPLMSSVRLSGLLLMENVNYTVGWNPSTGALVVDLTAGSAGPTNIPAGGSLVVRYTASASDDADPGATLTNSAVAAYNSWSGPNGRASTTAPAVSSITVQAAALAKTHDAAGNQASIGQPFTYTLSVTVPAHTTLQSAVVADNIADGLAVDGYATYVNGSPQAVGVVAPAAPFNGPAALAWTIASYNNSTDAAQQVQLRLNVRIRTNYSGGAPVPAGAVFANSATLNWAHGSTSANAPDVTAAAPNLTFAKANDASGPVVGGQPVNYTLTANNTGNGTSYQNVITDTLPVGMRGNTPVVTSVTRGGVTLTENVNYTVSWNPSTGALVVDLTAGSAGPTNLPAGGNLVVRYTASASDDAGAGATLTNSAVAAYNSWSGAGGGSYTTAPATSDITVSSASAAKTENAAGDAAAIGQPFYYTVGVNVPSRTSIYSAYASDVIPDGLEVTGTSTYVDGIPQSVGIVTVTPNPGDGTTAVNWAVGDYTNITSATQQLQLRIEVRVLTSFHDAVPVSGLPPQDTFDNTAFLTWDDAASGGTTHGSNASAPTVAATEPHLVLTEANDAAGPVTGNTPIHYTVTVVNDGTSTSYQNGIVQTFPAGMRGNTPAVTGVTLGGSFLTEGLNYTVGWDPLTGELTIDLTAGSDGPTNIPVGSDLVVSVTQSPSPDAGASAVLTDITSIGYDSWTNADGRRTDRTLNPADDNTDSSSVTMQAAAIAKTEDAAGDITTIGNTYTYTQTVTVPAYTSIYNAETADTLPDGLTVTGDNPSVGWTTVAENPSTGEWYVFWHIVDYTNDTAVPVDLTLTVEVRVDQAYHDATDVQAGDIFSNTAFLTWDDADTGGTTHNDSAAAPDVTVREPDLSMTKAVDDATPEAGDTVTYTIEVTNNGGWPAYDVVVSDTVDGALAYVGGSITGPGADASGDPVLTWDVDTGLGRGIDPLETVTLTFQAEVKGGAAYGQVVGNTAGISSYTGGQPDPYGRTYGPVSASRDVTCRAAVLEIAKTVLSGNNPDWGDTVTYQLTVTNNGDADAVSVGLRDTIPSPYFSYVNGSTSASWPGHTYTSDPAGAPGPDLDWAMNATLAPTETLVLTFDMSVDQWAAYGIHTNSGTAYGVDGAGTALPEDTATADIDVRRHPGVSVDKVLDDADGYVPVGDTFTYTITVTNTGNTGIPVVPLTDDYDPAYLGFVSATVTPDVSNPGSLTWNDLGSLAPQGTHQVTLTFEALFPGSTPDTDDIADVDTVDEFSNIVTSTSINRDLVITDPSIEVGKDLDHPDAFIPVGGTATYTITVTNDGDTALAAPVSLTDTYDPAYLQYVSATPPPSAVVAGTLTWDDLSGGAGMAPGSYVEVTVNFTLLQPGTSPDTDDTVLASAQDVHGTPVEDEYTNTGLTVTDPKLSVAKVVKPGQESPVRVQETAAFIITVTNTGDTVVPAPVHLTDDYDDDFLSYQGATPPPDNAVDDGSLYWTDVTGGAGLAVGASVSVEVDFTALKKGRTTDTAVVSGVVDAHGDPIAAVQSSASVDIGKIVGAASWFLAEGSTGGGFDTWVLLQNPGQETAEVELTFLTLEGPRPPLYFTLDPESRFTVRIQDYVPDDFHISTVISADQPIVAERSMYWDKRFWGTTSIPGVPQPFEMRAGHANLGTPMVGAGDDGYDLPTSVWFPEGSTAPGFDTWILICNPNDTQATVKIRLMNTTGAHNAGEVKVPAQSRHTVRLGDLMPGQAELATELTSDIGIVAERSMYWDPNAPVLQPYEMRGGHASPGSGQLAREWYIAEGSTGGGFDTYVSMQNPGTARAEVTASFLTPAGVAATETISMAAGTRATLRIQDYVPDDFFVATRVTADQPVVAERAMYWDKRVAQGVVNMQEGHSATGVIRAGTLWTVPEGSTGGGFDSWVLIANPYATDTEAAVVFMTETGPLAPINIVVPANSRYTIRVADYVPDNFHVSTTVEAEGLIVVERAMYWDKRVAAGIQPYEMMGGHSSVGVDP